MASLPFLAARRRFLVSLLCCTIALAGCRSGSAGQPGSTGKAEVEFWTMQLKPDLDPYMTKVIQEFEAQNPNVEVRWVDVPWADMERKILAAVAAGTAPDVVNLNPPFAIKLAERNTLLDMDKAVPGGEKALYFPNIWSASSLNQKTFGIPWYLSTAVTIYNADLFKKAGLTRPPTTYAELATTARQIKDKTGKYAFMPAFDGAQILESLVQMGVTLTDDQGRAAFNTPAGRAAFEYWVALYKNGLIPRDSLTEGHRRAIEMYQAGELAMLTSGAQFLRIVAQNAPDIAKVSTTAPAITGDTGLKNVSVMNIVIPASSDQQDSALKFALFLTNDANQLEFSRQANTLPSTVKAAQDKFFTQLPGGAGPMDQARLVSASQLKAARVLVPPIKDLARLEKTVYDNLQAAMLGQKSVDQALKDAESQWNGG
ncbi:sugar ABC transporter substrate-binding protein [Leptolyngbya sp. FACHB-261]|nr:sugar ABC transporter substrate-binding protein [Leptolyngbya sp. FACHB-261]